MQCKEPPNGQVQLFSEPSNKTRTKTNRAKDGSADHRKHTSAGSSLDASVSAEDQDAESQEENVRAGARSESQKISDAARTARCDERRERQEGAAPIVRNVRAANINSGQQIVISAEYVDQEGLCGRNIVK